MIEKDLNLILEIYEKYSQSYETLLNQAESVENKAILWSEFRLELYPHECALNAYKKPKIYKKYPVPGESFTINWLKNDEVFYYYNATIYESETISNESGASFILNETNNKICLRFLGESNGETDKMVLYQIYCVVYKDSLINKILFYEREYDDGVIDSERFETDKYSYNDNETIHTIVRDGFNWERDNILNTRTFRFDYVDGDILIYSKQLKLNLEDTEELMWTIKKPKEKRRKQI